MDQPLIPKRRPTPCCRACCNCSNSCAIITSISKRLICRCNTKSLLTIGPLLFFAISVEITASFVMGIVGRFEESVTGDRKAEFSSALIDALIICTCIALQKAALLYFKGRCALLWREELVNQQHKVYFHPRIFTSIHCQQNHQQNHQQNQQNPLQRNQLQRRQQLFLDNPDQRLSQDTDRLTLNLAELVTSGITLPGKVIFYSIALSNLFGWFAPCCCFVFFIVGTIPNLILLHRVVPYLIQQERLEGNFRHCHSEIRNSAESISFSRGTQIDQIRATNSLKKLILNQHQVLYKQLPLNIIVQLCDYMGSVVNYGILGLSILYLSSAEGKTPSQIAGLLASGSYACMYLINSFTSMFDLSNYAADIVAYGERVEDLFNYDTQRRNRDGEDGENENGGDDNSSGSSGSNGSNGSTNNYARRRESRNLNSSASSASSASSVPSLLASMADNNDVLLIGNNVTLRSPPSTLNMKGKKLVTNLDFIIKKNENTLLRGESGVGKSTLLRAIAHIGDCHLPGVTLGNSVTQQDITFVPQSPFMFTGTLEELLSYPRSIQIVFEQDKRQLNEFISALDLNGIVKIAGGWNIEFDWTTLSPGEQQRVALIRLMMRPPTLAVLDESFTALDSDMVERCLIMLKKMTETTCVFVSHSERLEEYCDQIVVLERYGDARVLLPQ